MTSKIEKVVKDVEISSLTKEERYLKKLQEKAEEEEKKRIEYEIKREAEFERRL